MKFLRKHKKAVIICGVLLVVLLTAIILMFTLFKLKKVEVNLKTETLNLTDEVLEEIKEETLSKSGSVLFFGKDKLIKDLESKFPYLKIINIETKIPDQFVIHCAEREEFFRVESQGKTFYLDEELKILRVQDGEANNDCVELKIRDYSFNEATQKFEEKYLDLNLENAKAGQFLKLGGEISSIGNINDLACQILSAFEQNNRNIGLVKGAYSKFEIYFVLEELESGLLNWRMCLEIVDGSGLKTKIIDANKNLAEKIGVMLEAIGNEKPSSLIGKTLNVYEDSDGKFVYALI